VTLQAELVSECACELGESPLWMPDQSQLAWLDIIGQRLYRLHPADGTIRVTVLPEMITAIGLCTATELIASTRVGFGMLDPDTGAVRHLGPALIEHSAERMNDGAVAPDGSFWAGSQAPEDRAGSGSVWRIDATGTTTRQISGVTISNGIDWFPRDSQSMLYVDSASGGVDLCAIADDQTVTSRHRLIDIDETDGEPDGLTIDEGGNAWVAIWGAGEVRSYDSSGRLHEVVLLPARNVSSCIFGGPDRRTLYITSARQDLERPGPLDGCLYACRMPQRGQAPRRFQTAPVKT
jgi:sugar lactone lactonase YvrE